MDRATRQLDVNGKPVAALLAEGPADLEACLQAIRQANDRVDRYQKPATLLSKFFQPKAVDNTNPLQAVLYRNGDLQSLILTNGKDHYFYNLTHGYAATIEVKEILGKGLVDVSGGEVFKLMRDYNFDVGRVRLEMEKNLRGQGPGDLSRAVNYAFTEIDKLRTPEARQRLTGGR